MKKYIVLSVNQNPDYLYFLPLTIWAWRKFGWEPIIMWQGKPINKEVWSFVYNHKGHGKEFSVTSFYFPDDIEGYRSDTITQISRLYAACVQDGYLMTGDIDMIPLSDYWKPNENEITVYGPDLTGYKHYPICYIGMPSEKWKQVMKLDSPDYNALIKRDLDTLPQAKDPDFYQYWFSDQDLITKRINESKQNFKSVIRGQYKNGFAVGRVDRGAWTLDHKQFIDAHLHHQIYHKGREAKFNQALDLLYKVWPDDDFGWFVEYHHKFKKLTGHA